MRERRREKNYEFMYNSDLFISRVEYLLFTNDNRFFEVPLFREAKWWSAQTVKLNLDRNADIMFN